VLVAGPRPGRLAEREDGGHMRCDRISQAVKTIPVAAHVDLGVLVRVDRPQLHEANCNFVRSPDDWDR
jgi:hypothetical protein